MEYSFLPCGDSAVTVLFKKEISKENNALVTSLDRLVNDRKIKGVTETVSAFSSLTVFYDCTVISFAFSGTSQNSHRLLLALETERQ